MELSLNKEEQQQLLQCIDVAIKTAQNSLQTANVLLPLAAKISALGSEEQQQSSEESKSTRKSN